MSNHIAGPERTFRRGESPGFALIIAITLMGFVLLLMISLSVFVQTEAKLSGIQSSVTKARMNAIFALQEALGQLQKYAGPDQRVTAQAQIQDAFAGADEAAMTFTSVANPYFTLVWDVSGADGQDPGAVPGHHAGWKPAVLVSGNAALGFDPSSGDPYPDNYVTASTVLDPDDDDVVTLVDANNPEGAGDFRIYVPRVPLTDTDGSYAWWIGDENVKARLNLNEQVDENTHADAAWLTPQHLSPQVNGLFDGVDLVELERLDTFGEIGINVNRALAGSPSVQYFLKDYSLVSNSLFTDTRNGGLKKDLTYGLDASHAAPGGLADADFLFSRSLGGAPEERSPNMNFIQWGSLRDFYNTRVGDEVVTTRANRRPDTSYEEDYRSGIKPVITHFQMGVYADFVNDEVRFIYYPVLVLWNPYRFDIEFPELHLIFKEHQGGNSIEVTQIYVKDETGNLVVDNESFLINTMPFTVESATIPAGRAMIFTPAPPASTGTGTADLFDEYAPDNGSGSGIYADPNKRNYLYAGYNQGIGLYQMSGIKLDGASGGSGGGESEVIDSSKCQISFTLASGERFYLSLHERTNSSNKSFSSADFYQLITGLPSSSALGTAAAQYYQPIVNGYPNPKFLYTISMPFAETGFFSTTQAPRQWAGMFNPRATVNTVNAVTFGYGSPTNYVGGYHADSDAEADSVIQTADGTYTYVGTSANFGGADRAILFDLPREAPHALAQFAHANLTAPPVYTNIITQDLMDTVGGNTRTGWKGEFMRPMRLSFTGAGDDYTPAYTVGTSQANPYIPVDAENTDDQTRYWRFFDRDDDKYAKMVWDFPYLVNEVLFDRYYFSTVPQSGNLEEPFRNPLVKTINGVSDHADDLRSYEVAASQLYMKGGFNVNSTSVEAWSALLSAFRDQPYGSDEGDGSLFARFYEPVGDELSAADMGPLEAGSVYGYRRLSDEQIKDLAERIVEQVKLRGPFPSMAAFVNRVMYSEALYRDDLSADAPDPHGIYPGGYDLEQMVMLKGALSAALELAQCNERFYGGSDTVDSGAGLSGSSAEKLGFYGSIGTDLPGYLSQVDLLSVLGSAMTVRSDTFTIKVYGSTDDPITGEVQAEAYAEAVVQRVPEYVASDLNEAWDSPDDLDDTNRTFGRKFKIVSFRWIRKDDIIQ